MSSKYEITKKKCDSNLNENKKNLDKYYNQGEYCGKDDVNFETRIERNYENKNDDEKRQECKEDYDRSCDITDNYEEKSKTDSYIDASDKSEY